MMNTSDVYDAFQAMGWLKKRQNREDILFRNLGGKEVSIFPKVTFLEAFRGRPAEYELDLGEAVSSEVFSSIYAKIEGTSKRAPGLVPLSLSPTSTRLTRSAFTNEDLAQASEKIVRWARDFNLAEALEALSSLPTQSAGSLPLKHLAALAVLHETDRLQAYRQSFEEGDRLGFVPYMSIDMIERAIDLSRFHEG